MSASVPVWAITDFQDEDEAPHWAVAYIEAPTAESAMETLGILIHDEKRRPETVWESAITPREQWKATEAIRPLTFILGGGCR